MKTWKDLQKNVYSRYSGRTNVCIVEAESGSLFPGVRIENASFPLTISAYQSAVFSCLSEGDVPKILYIPEDNLPAEAQWIVMHYNLTLQTKTFPKGSFRKVIHHEPVDFRGMLGDLQHFCKIDESNFPVSCLLEVEEGIYISGVNIEVPDWQIGLCAERVAISKALSYGYKGFKSIHIAAAKGEFISPCGACRQVLVEHIPYKKSILYHPDGTLSEHTIADLLPAFFNGDSISL
jgi:homotetrameric cytidine deaminase